jgi:hypothetical protein
MTLVANVTHCLKTLHYVSVAIFRTMLELGLHNGKYLKPPAEASKSKQISDELQPGISPHVFKFLAKGMQHSPQPRGSRMHKNSSYISSPHFRNCSVGHVLF